MAQRRRLARGWLGVAVVAAVVALAAVTPSPFVVQRPGPVVDALGEVDTDDGPLRVVTISGTETFETDGAINVLSVTVSGTPAQPSRWLTVLGAWLDPTRTPVPVADIYPQGMSSDDRRMLNERLMRDSQVSATVAALDAAGAPVERAVSIVEVTPGGPADGLLAVGDLVRSVDGVAVADVPALRAELKTHGAKDPVALEIERDGEIRAVSVVPTTDEAGDPVLRVAAATEVELPFEVDLELDTIGGPSAGLVFALAVYDLLTPGGLTGGLRVSGTGTIDEAGAVGAIGGLRQKLWGAEMADTDLLLMPLANCADLPERVPDGLVIAPVATLDEAIDAIEAAARGEDPGGLERCDPATVG